MKRKTTTEKLAEIKAYCKKKKCESCPLILTAYCMSNDTSEKAVDEAYRVMQGGPMKGRKNNA